MDKNKNSPVEGRLSIPSPAKTEPHAKFARMKTNYGVERLGITSDSEEPVWALSGKPKSLAPHTDAAEPITVLPVSKEIPGQSESHETTEAKHRYYVSSKLSRYKNILGRKKIMAILLLSGIPVIALTLILWFSLGGKETAPQAASAMHATRDTSKSPQNSLETAKRLIKPAGGKMLQHPKSEQEISAATPTRSTFREVFEFLAEMKPAPKTTASVPAPPKPDKPQDTASEPAAKAASVIALAPSRLGLRLGGIMRGIDGNIALINNRSVKVGQTVNRAKVVHIGDFSVEVELDGQKYLVGISSPPPRDTSDEDEDEEESSDSDDEDESKTEDEE